MSKGEVMRTVGMEKRTDGRQCRIKSALDNWLSVGAKERSKNASGVLSLNAEKSEQGK